MKQSGKVALGGMLIALSVVILIPSVLEVFSYTLPAIAGMLTMFAVVELNKKWAAGVYAATSILGLFLVPNKEAVVLYAVFFGYYPIIKAILESKLPRAAEYIVKFAIFNAALVTDFFVMTKIFGMPFDEFMGIQGETGGWVKYIVPIMLVLGNLVFIVFDIAVTRIITVYLNFWQKRFHKMFRFR
ncbi:MAG: hypothetical protein IJ491_06150 [Clostridia bacterium]|nr:hypothetical protein [Clostridia bacterium]